MTVRVKICGINAPDAFDAAMTAGADHVGFVFFARSPRHVLPAQAAALSDRRRGGPSRVGLFVAPDPEEIAATLAVVSLDILQIYADAAFVAAMRSRFGLTVWRAVGVADRADLPAALDGADGFVVEAKPPPGATRPGGNATLFDWSLLSGWKAPGPWLLAGGLTPDNVGAAIFQSGAGAVDVSSGVETAPGVKSPALIERFVMAAREPGRVSEV